MLRKAEGSRLMASVGCRPRRRRRKIDLPNAEAKAEGATKLVNPFMHAAGCIGAALGWQTVPEKSHSKTAETNTIVVESEHFLERVLSCTMYARWFY